MNEILIGLVLFCFIVFMFKIEKENKNDLIKKNTINNIIKVDKTDNNIDTDTDSERKILLTYSNTPSFRGFVDLYQPEVIKEEGGSKPFKEYMIDNNNLTANQVNYTNYESYRKKPFTIK